MYRIMEKEEISDSIVLFEISAPEIARKAEAGNFFILKIDEKGERIPLTIADFDRQRGTITTVFQKIGKSTYHLGSLRTGDALMDVIGPLGKHSHIENFGTVICIGGGVGIAPVFPIARALKRAGNTVHSIIGARTKSLLFWEEKMKSVSDEFIVTTDDGSYGRKAVVTIPLDEMLRERGGIQRVIAIGPAIMMKFVCITTEKYNVTTVVSLNSIMVDGTGMCGACRIEAGGSTQFACVDGPEFDGHQVDFDLLMARQRMYLDEEKEALERYREASGVTG